MSESILWNPWTIEIKVQVNRYWRNSTTYRPRDPLAIDLDGDGIETIGITTNPILFDHNGDGIRTGTGWLKGDDAWLVRDLNGNGQIDSGAELFGVDTVINGTQGQRKAYSGFEALATLDTGDGSTMSTASGYKDNVFDAKDAAFSQVRLWQDLNQNGISEANELSTLADKGIVSINLAATSDTVNLGNGNTVTGKATVTRTTGTTTIDSVSVTSEAAGNLGLATNGFYRSFTDTIPLTDAARALPEMRGSGFVRDLREAASLSPELAGIVAQFAQASTRAAQLALVDGLLESWAKSSGKYDAPKVIEPIKMEVVGETSTQQTWHITVMEPDQAAIVMAGDMVYDAMDYSFSANSPYMSTDINEVTHLTYHYVNATGMEVLRKKSVLEVFNGQRFVDAIQVFNKVSTSGGLSSGGGGGGGGVMQTTGPRIVMGSVISQPQVDLLTQAYEELRQSVYSGLLLQTRLAPYLDAVQLIVDNQGIHFDTTALETKFNQAFDANPQEAMLDLLDMNLYAQDTMQAVGFNGAQKLKGWLDGLATDSPIWSTLAAAGLLPTGTTNGTVYRDLMFGKNTTEYLHLGSGNDLAFAQGGDDLVFGDDGDDTLDGGAGNDGLYGGNGADTYLFGRGSGQDTISNSDNDVPGSAPDVIQLQYDIAPSDVKLTRSGNDLVLTINDTVDSLRVNSYFSADGATPNAVDYIKFSDFTVWDVSKIKQLVTVSTTGADEIWGYNGVDDTLSGDAGNDTIFGETGNDSLKGDDGNDSLFGWWGNDTLDGGANNDTLFGEQDGDLLLGNTGDDVLSGQAGDDTLEGGAGNDLLFGGQQYYYDGPGNDTYRFGKGDGQDLIYDKDTVAGNVDTIEFKAGVLSSEVLARRNDKDLVLTINGTTDKLTVSAYFDPTNACVIEQIKFKDGTVWDVATINAAISATTQSISGNTTALVGTTLSDRLLGDVSNDTLSGLDGIDFLFGGQGNDSLSGGSDADLLYGDAGQDILDGGTGADTMAGGTGDDYYFVDNAGDAVIELYSDSEPGSYDTIETMVSTTLATNVEALVAADNAGGISLTGNDDGSELYGNLSNNYIKGGANLDVLSGGGGVDTLEGGGGDDFYLLYDNKATLIEAVGGGADQIWAYANNITMADNIEKLVMMSNAPITATGNDGNNNMSGNSRNNVLDGKKGNDRIYGKAGNDVLTGGLGDDTIDGGSGDDRYVFSAGDGADTIIDTEVTGLNADVLAFGSAIRSDQLWFAKSGNNLQVSVIGTADKVTVNNWYTSDSNKIETFTAAGDTKSLSCAKVDDLVNAMAGFTPPALGQTALPTGYQTQLNSVIAASWC